MTGGRSTLCGGSLRCAGRSGWRGSWRGGGAVLRRRAGVRAGGRRGGGRPAQGTEHHLLMVLATYNEQYGSQTYPSIETLATHIHKTPRYTFTLLTSLEAHGHLKIARVKEPGKRPRNYYTVLRPWETPAVQSTEQMITDIDAPLDREKEEEIKTSKIAVIKCSLLSPEVEEYPLSKASVQVS